MKQILVVEDESSIRGFEVINLKRAGYDVLEAESGEQALELFLKHSGVSLAILDVGLPGIDGYEVCRRIRALRPGVGIIMLTARAEEVDKVTGLMTGADDYVTKPFSPTEFIARVDALMRRLSLEEGAREEVVDIHLGPFFMDMRSHIVTKNGRQLRLTQVEFGILKMFMENPGKALSREDILAGVWSDDYEGDLKIVDVNIRRLRVKIENDSQNPEYIVTVWGFGYKWGS
ncbi:DNA-binding response regulator [Clostridia bacterium]|nr:DNA-binding response regulator [Clostridia bacterium]